MCQPKIFISYSSKDGEWVRNWLLPQLESNGLKTHIDYRDFEIGVPSVVNMERAVEQCAKTLLVFTPNWIDSEWAQFEGIMLQTLDPTGLRKKILPLMLETCPLPLRLRTLTYTDFRDKNDWDSQLQRLVSQTAKDFAALVKPSVSFPPLDAKHIDITRLPKTEFELFGREKELQLLNQAWDAGDTHVISFVAYGGVGKTTLVNKWAERMRWENYRGAQKVYAWSFYSQGTNEKVTSADLFIHTALKWFGDKDPAQGSPWDKGKRLAELIRQHKILLLLDGMEPLQSDYDFEKGRIKDQALSLLLTELAKWNPGLCVITTRERVPEVDRCPASCRQVDLEKLSSAAGGALLRVRGVQGTEAELEKAASAFGNHALAINLLASYLHDIPGHHISQAAKIPDLDIPEDQGRHPRRVIEAFAQKLGPSPEVQVLHILGLFNRPAPLAAIDAVKKEPAITNLTDRLQKLTEAQWLHIVERLRRCRLLAPQSHHDPDKIDCHPLIREHFSQKLKAKGKQAWKEAHSRLYEYYKNLPERELPDTLEEMEPLFVAVAHGCQAGKYREALVDTYYSRIHRSGEENYCCNKLGAFGADLAALTNFFEIPWRQPAAKLTAEAKAVVLSWAGFRLQALGRLREALQPMEAGRGASIKEKIWIGAATDTSNLSELYLITGDVPQAIAYARQSVDIADRSGDDAETIMDLTGLAYAQHQGGELAAAVQAFREAEFLHQQHEFEYRYLFSLEGFRFCDLLLSQGKVQEVLERAKEARKIAEKIGANLLTFALDKLSLGRAYLLEASDQLESTSEVGSNLQRAAVELNQAVRGLREAGQQDDLPRGLFARAFLYRLQNDFSHAWDDLAEAQEIAERGGMKLWLVDYHLEAARVIGSQFSAISDQPSENSSQRSAISFRLIEEGREVSVNMEGMVDRLKMHVEQAAALVHETGYHRRDPEVELGYANLFFAQGDQAKAREHLGRAKKLLDKMGVREWDWQVRRLEEGD
jgi:tetratricopeptide (TPR) repeat protein